jgi:hypothetical protein
MATLAPFILTRTFQDLDATKALKRKCIQQQNRSARFLGNRLIALWVSITRVNFLLFQDHVNLPDDLHILAYHITSERELFLEVGGLVANFDKATPNYHIGLHFPNQVWLCTPTLAPC